MAIIDFTAAAAPVGDTGSREPALAAIRAALDGYARRGDAAELDRGLEAGRALVTAAHGAGAIPDPQRLRELARACPEFDALLDVATGAAAEALVDAGARLWAELGLHRASPRWTATERAAARTIFACACATPAAAGTDWLSASLRRVAAARIATTLCDELAGGEAVWLRILGGRYGSLRHRCAPRTARRSRGLSDMMRADPDCRAAVQRRAERWVSGGGWTDELAAELEAAVVHCRTPSRLA